MKNTGKQYETLVEEVFLQLMEQDSVENITMTKNKILKGKSTSHEIDVYWEFKMGGITYSTIIQAKDWKDKVPQGEILKFKAIIDDLPGQPRAIFITRTGYQKGALKFASVNDILLYELRKPEEKDWEGRIKTIILNFRAYIPHTKIEIIPDKKWMQDEANKIKIGDTSISIYGNTDQLYLKNQDGTIWKSIQEVLDLEQKQLGMQEISNKIVFIEMNEEIFMDTQNSLFPRIKIKKLKLNLSMRVIKEEEKIIDASTMVGFILKNTIEGSIEVLDKNIKLRKRNLNSSNK